MDHDDDAECDDDDKFDDRGYYKSVEFDDNFLYCEIFWGGDNGYHRDDKSSYGFSDCDTVSTSDTSIYDYLAEHTHRDTDDNESEKLRKQLDAYNYAYFQRVVHSSHDDERKEYRRGTDYSATAEFLDDLYAFLNSVREHRGAKTPLMLYNVRMSVLLTVMSFYNLPRVTEFRLDGMRVILKRCFSVFKRKTVREKKSGREIDREMLTHPRDCRCYHHTRWGDNSSTNCSSDEDNSFHYKDVEKESPNRFYANVKLKPVVD